MSLTIDKNAMPIIVTGTTSTSVEVIGRAIYLRYVYWYKPTTKGHLLSLVDGNERSITKGIAAVADDAVILPVFGIYDSIKCDDMDSGTLYIYHK